MNIGHAIHIGFKNIAAYKARSLLTVMGIVLGVASLIATSAIVNGMEKGLMEPLVSMGGIEKVWIHDFDVPPEQSHLQDQSTGLTLTDVKALKVGAPLLRVIAPRIMLERVTVTARGKQIGPSTCSGVTPAMLDLDSHEVEHGRFFTDLDEQLAHSVCVIGTGIRDELFGSPTEVGREIIPLGEVINLNGEPMTIVGMFKRYERERTRIAREKALANNTWSKEKQSEANRRLSRWDSFWSKNNLIHIPLNTMRLKLNSGASSWKQEPGLSHIGIKAKNLEDLDLALQQINNVLVQRHRGLKDFKFNYFLGRLRDDIEKRISDARFSGSLIAGLSLLVGGIGIMNIMLASINERIREIGTCKAIGATPASIFTQILTEGLVLAIIGGVTGIAVSFALVHGLNWITDGQAGAGAGIYSRDAMGNVPAITSTTMTVAMTFSIAVGVTAGIFPAVKAARLNPIESLRYE